MPINAYEISLADSLPVKRCVLPTFLIASRKNRRNLFTGFLHNIQTSGAARSGWHSWGRKDTSRTIRQLGNCSLKGICPSTASIPATVALAPTEPRRSPRAPVCPRLAFLLFLLSDAVFSLAPAYCLLKETCSPSLRAAGELPVLPLFAQLG